jgi:hypothetical protein
VCRIVEDVNEMLCSAQVMCKNKLNYNTSIYYIIIIIIASLNSAVHEATDRSIPQGSIKGSNFPSWFSHTLQQYILNKNYYYRLLKRISLTYTAVNFPTIGNL